MLLEDEFAEEEDYETANENIVLPPDDFDNDENDYLSRHDVQQCSVSFVDKWKDVPPQHRNTFFTIDSAKRETWKLAQKEIIHVKQRLRDCEKKNLFKTLDEDVSPSPAWF